MHGRVKNGTTQHRHDESAVQRWARHFVKLFVCVCVVASRKKMKKVGWAGAGRPWAGLLGEREERKGSWAEGRKRKKRGPNE